MPFVPSKWEIYSACGPIVPPAMTGEVKDVWVVYVFSLYLREYLQIIEGLKEVLIGMKPGGKRRALIPPSVGYISENLKPVPEEFWLVNCKVDYARNSCFSHVFIVNVIGLSADNVFLQFGPRRSLMSHMKEPLIFEVQLLKVLS
ncbi:hypothetical protein H5410_049469 [Solanum commersonii]|uniref:Rotamase n=1 Tax=Solanum commersonii TaxID=4109 RepID=A0A9J5WT04_SOLCO|nr:hypothetical protein H5410_049469 [Solanum commersonii]